MISPPSWLDPEQPYLLGISGGRDSIFLYHWLTEAGFKHLHCCHLNHQLRGDESDRDEAFLRDHLDNQFISARQDVAEYSRKGKISIETAAREARHQFFAQCAARLGSSQVLLAHHAEDQAETILFKLLRGSAGLKGMRDRHEIDGLTFFRPMLSIRRHEIDDFLAHRNIPYREDATNALPEATRNRLRNEALPLLAEIMQRDVSASLIRSLEASRTTLPQNQNLEFYLDPQGRLHLPTLRELHSEILPDLLYQFLLRHQIPNLSRSLLLRAATLIPPDGPPALSLPGGLRLRRKEARLFISA